MAPAALTDDKGHQTHADTRRRGALRRAPIVKGRLTGDMGVGGVAGRVGMEARARDTAVGPHESVTLISIKVKDPGPSRSHSTMSGCFGKAEPCVSIHSRIWRRDPVHSDTTREGPRVAVW